MVIIEFVQLVCKIINNFKEAWVFLLKNFFNFLISSSSFFIFVTKYIFCSFFLLLISFVLFIFFLVFIAFSDALPFVISSSLVNFHVVNFFQTWFSRFLVSKYFLFVSPLLFIFQYLLHPLFWYFFSSSSIAQLFFLNFFASIFDFCYYFLF